VPSGLYLFTSESKVLTNDLTPFTGFRTMRLECGWALISWLGFFSTLWLLRWNFHASRELFFQPKGYRNAFPVKDSLPNRAPNPNPTFSPQLQDYLPNAALNPNPWFSPQLAEKACSAVHRIVKENQNELYKRNKALLNDPSLVLNCAQLARSIAKWDLSVSSTMLERLRTTVKLLESAEREVHICALGGSVTAGSADYEPKLGTSGAWPRMFEILLRGTFKKTNISVLNTGIGGWGATVYVEKFESVKMLHEEHKFDAFVGEFLVSDQCDFSERFERAKEEDSASQKLFPLLLGLKGKPSHILLDLFRNGNTTFEVERHCHGHNLTAKDGSNYCPQWWLLQSWQEPAAARWKMPIVSYRDAVWPTLDYPPDRLSYYWDGMSHPGLRVHNYFAQTLLYGYLYIREELEQAKLTETNSKPTCLDSVTYFTADGGNSSRFPAISNGCWEFRDEGRGRYGWIIDIANDGPDSKCKGADRVLQFKVKTGIKHIYRLEFLGSYGDEWGDVRMWVNASNSLVASSRFKPRRSVPHFEALTDKTFKPETLVTVNIELLSPKNKGHNKFKILGLQSC